MFKMCALTHILGVRENMLLHFTWLHHNFLLLKVIFNEIFGIKVFQNQDQVGLLEKYNLKP